MSKYGVISGPYFPVFGLNTEIYGVKSLVNSRKLPEFVKTVLSPLVSNLSKSNRINKNSPLRHSYGVNLVELQRISEVYLEPNQTSTIELFAKLVKAFQLLTIFAKNSIADVWLGFKYSSEFFAKIF